MHRCFKTDTRLETDIEKLCELAQEDLLNAFSCLKIAIQNPEREFLLECALDFKRNLDHKLILAAEIASLTEKSVAQLVHAPEQESKDSQADECPVVEG